MALVIKYVFSIPADDLFFVAWQWPDGIEWLYILILGTAALFGQYFVTLAYGADKAGIVSVFSYANIIFSVFIGWALGDRFPEWMTWMGIGCIIISGAIISLMKRKNG